MRVEDGIQSDLSKDPTRIVFHMELPLQPSVDM